MKDDDVFMLTPGEVISINYEDCLKHVYRYEGMLGQFSFLYKPVISFSILHFLNHLKIIL